MKIPGFEGFAKALPDYSKAQAKRMALRLPGIAILCVILQILFVNVIPKFILDDYEPLFPIIANIVFLFFGTIIAQTGFRAKDRLLQEDKATAYQKVVKKVLGGISMVFSAMVFSFIPIFAPTSSITQFMETPFLLPLGTTLVYLRVALGIVLTIIGALTALRAVQSFGIDSASLVYVYYPEEAKIIDHEIYSVIRHPMYLSISLIAFGSFFINFSLYATIFLGITIISFYRHIFLVEEKELFERFGDSYKEYAKEVPALIAHPKNWGKYLKFIRG